MRVCAHGGWQLLLPLSLLPRAPRFGGGMRVCAHGGWQLLLPLFSPSTSTSIWWGHARLRAWGVATAPSSLLASAREDGIISARVGSTSRFEHPQRRESVGCSRVQRPDPQGSVRRSHRLECALTRRVGMSSRRDVLLRARGISLDGSERLERPRPTTPSKMGRAGCEMALSAAGWRVRRRRSRSPGCGSLLGAARGCRDRRDSVDAWGHGTARRRSRRMTRATGNRRTPCCLGWRERAALDAEEGRWLLRALRSAAHVHLGFGSFLEYTERLFGYKPRTTQEKLRVAESLETLPRLARALETGALSWCAVRELTRVAVADTETAWLDAARGKTLRELETLVASKAPETSPMRLRPNCRARACCASRWRPTPSRHFERRCKD